MNRKYDRCYKSPYKTNTLVTQYVVLLVVRKIYSNNRQENCSYYAPVIKTGLVLEVTYCQQKYI